MFCAAGGDLAEQLPPPPFPPRRTPVAHNNYSTGEYFVSPRIPKGRGPFKALPELVDPRRFGLRHRRQRQSSHFAHARPAPDTSGALWVRSHFSQSVQFDWYLASPPTWPHESYNYSTGEYFESPRTRTSKSGWPGRFQHVGTICSTRPSPGWPPSAGTRTHSGSDPISVSPV